MASKDTDNPPGQAPAPDPDPATAPDPDEDDLDELDDMLDEFSATKIDSSTPAAPTANAVTPDASGPGRPPPTVATTASAQDPSTSTSDEAYADDFAKELQAGMAQMLQDLESNPDMAKQFEEMFAQFGAPPTAPPTTSTNDIPDTAKPTPAAAAASKPTSAASAAAAAASAKAQDDAFQETIRRTMDRMQASSNSADAASAQAQPSPLDDDMMASLLRELQSSTGDGDGDDSFSKMLLGMMEQLTNKDILYEPMKELDSKFPAWLAENGAALPAEDKQRYETQRALVAEIVQRFERDGYKDENPDDREYIVERMQQMQAAGAPPPDLVGDVDAANEMLSGLDQGCAQQ